MTDWLDRERVIRFEGVSAASPRFVRAPVLRWRPLPAASRYEVAVADRDRVVWTGATTEAAVDLTPAWALLPLGPVDVLVRGFDGERETVVRAHRQFWRVPGVDTASAEAPPERADWTGCVHRAVAYLLGDARDATADYEKAGPRSAWSSFEDTVTGLRARLAFPAQHHTSFIFAYLDYAARFGDTELGGQAEIAALAYGEWLLANRLPDDWRCGGLAPSTVLDGGFGGWVEGENITLFRAGRVGDAMVRLADHTGDDRYLHRARRIADVFVDLQKPDGSWPHRVDPRTGAVVVDYTSAAVTPLRFLIRLGEFDAGAPAAQRAAWAEAAARADAWLLAGPVADGRWEGMYEDVPETEPWTNLENWDTNETIRHLLAGSDDRADGPDRVRLAASLNAFVEDQFVVWAPEESSVPVRCPTPMVLEQYRCYWPMEVHTGNWLVSLLALHRATGESHYLAKATAAANAIAAVQDEQGSLSTWGFDTRFGERLLTTDWPGCNAGAVSALLHWTEYVESVEKGEPFELGYRCV